MNFAKTLVLRNGKFKTDRSNPKVKVWHTKLIVFHGGREFKLSAVQSSQ